MAKQSFPVTSAQKATFDVALTAEEQEKLPPPLSPGWYQPVRPPRTRKDHRRKQILEQFDPLNENYVADTFINRQHPNWFEIAIITMFLKNAVGKLSNGNFVSNLNNLLVSQMMDKIRDSVHNRFKINYSYIYLLRNIETNKTLVWFQDRQKSPWFATHGDAQAWLEQQEERRLGGENINRPNTKFVFEKHLSVQIKVILDRQPLRVGEGRLPNWLRTKKGLIALDVFDDNLCVFRCLAVHRGAHKKDNLRKTRKLARQFFTLHDIPNEIVEFQHIPLIAKHFNQEIIVYDVTPEGVFALKGWFKDDMGEAREVLGEDEEWVLEEDEEEGKNHP